MTPAELEELAARTARELYSPVPAAREAALEELEALYVTLADGSWVTMPEVARAALFHAKRALVDPQPAVRVSGARAIELFACDLPECVAELRDALTDPVPMVRLAALEALCEFGPAAALAAPQAAERLVHGDDIDERAAAADVLGNTDTAMNSVDALVNALLNDAPPVQASAAHALGRGLESEIEATRLRVSKALERLARSGT